MTILKPTIDSRSEGDTFQEPWHSIIQLKAVLRQDETDSENEFQKNLHSEQKLESEWMGIVRRKGQRKKLEPIGAGANRGRNLEAAKQTTWLYVGIWQETSPLEMVEHMVDKGIEGEIDCE